MSELSKPLSVQIPLCWREDLRSARDLTRGQIESYGFFIAWFESWRIKKSLQLERVVARRSWREVVTAKRREPWQLSEWVVAMRWFLEWVEISQRVGVTYRSLAERVKGALNNAGARRGLSLNTRRTYGGWLARYALWVEQQDGGAEEMMETARARVWLGDLVTKTQVSFSTQKQALNALVFFFKDVCGRWIQPAKE